jgi:hypothetical protein
MNRLSAAYSNLKGCAAPTSAACKEVVTYGGVCGYTDASFGLTGQAGGGASSWTQKIVGRAGHPSVTVLCAHDNELVGLSMVGWAGHYRL